jgi:thiol-disulfide isomerase/thioredoxin
MRVYDSFIHALFFMKKQKKFSWQNVLFIVVILLLLIPQTRTPIQVALNKVKVAIFSPSAFAKADQQQLKPFTYSLTSLDGASKEVSIGTGKVTFISYWATWCPPCIAELPSIEALYKDYGDKVEFLLITNENPEVVARFMAKKSHKLPAVLPAMETPEQLFERSIPTTYIIDKTGHIIIKEKGASNWNSDAVRTTLDELIAED